MYEEEEEYDNRIKLDKEFLNGQYCTIYELNLLLRDKQNKISKTQQVHNVETVFYRTLQYADRFNKYGLSEDLEKGATKSLRIRSCIDNDKLDRDEQSLLINLLPMKAEEAISLIPSLKNKISENDLQHYLDELIKLSKVN